MLGDSSSSLLAADSGGDGAGVDGGGMEREGGERGMFGGNRWPRQETLALLQIRSEMDGLFRDSSAKGPLWEEISRKLAELGYHRSAKKCKEKFENVYKYHKRTRETRTGKQVGKNYRFFDQLEAFDSSYSLATAATTPPQPPPRSATIMPSVAPPITTPTPVHHIVTSANFLSIPSLPMANPIIFPQSTTLNPSSNNLNIPTNMSKNPFSNVNSTSSSTFSDDGLLRSGGKKKKRKWKVFFGTLMKDVMEKQDELQSKFLESIERRERERMAREDSWRLQEMARINKERELLAQERSMAAAKDTAVMAFLQKLAEQKNLGPVKFAGNNLNFPPPSQPPPVPPPIPPQPPQPPPPPPQSQTNPAIVEVRKSDNGDYFASPQQTSSSRWPKVEIEALIQLRTNLDSKYLENGPKGPLWEEISAAMKRLGYDRSSKRCKEKWENINKYFKKVKESSKKRRDDAKTCPYFKQLDAIYSERSSSHQNMAPLMVTPEQQWHPQQDQAPRNYDHDMEMEEGESDHLDDEEEEDEDDDEDGDGGEYEVVANAKPSSNGAIAAV